MQLKLNRSMSLLFVIVTLLVTAHAVSAQRARAPKRLKNPATVKGFVGGEAIDHYVIRAQKGRRMRVSLSWKSEDNNWAKVSVSSSARTFRTFGTLSSDEKNWTGKIPRTGDYYIEVYAHPSAHYVLRVTIK